MKNSEMEKLPDRFLCNHCGHITTKDYFVCPACQNGMDKKYESEKGQSDDKQCGEEEVERRY